MFYLAHLYCFLCAVFTHFCGGKIREILTSYDFVVHINCSAPKWMPNSQE